MKPLSTATSVESEEFPDRFSDTWDRGSTTGGTTTTAASRDHEESGLVRQLLRRLPCDRCWSSLIASAAITAFIVGGVLVIVALLVRHHDEKMEQLERSQDGVLFTSTSGYEAITKDQVDSQTQTGATIMVRNYCASRPCLNGGTCLNRVDGAQCTCPRGFVQPICATTIAARGICASSPCSYDANCTEIQGGTDFECSCPDGLSGRRCEIVSCGSDLTLQATDGVRTIGSPDWPNDALPNVTCSWTLSAAHLFVRLAVEDLRLSGDSCDESSLSVIDAKTARVIERYCPSNSTSTRRSSLSLDTRGSRIVRIEYEGAGGSHFRMSYSSPDIDPCSYFNGARCVHGKCWQEDESSANCVCDPCFRGVGCSEADRGNCTATDCANGGTCTYNCYVQTKRCLCTQGYDPRTNCQQRCTDIRRCP